MGSSISKRVSNKIQNSPNFNGICTTIFTKLETQSKHNSPGKIFAHQLPDAATTLKYSLSSSLITNWCRSPPPPSLIDAAYWSIRRNPKYEETLDIDEFKRFAVALFTDAVVTTALKAFMVGGCVGVALIFCVWNMLHGAGGEVVGFVIGVYVVGLAASIFISLR